MKQPSVIMSERWMFSIHQANKRFFIVLELEDYINPFKGERFASAQEANYYLNKATAGGRLPLKRIST
jgi:hypothetical protein